MTTVPAVTITITGMATASPDIGEKNLHMVYFQAVKGDVRIQWVVFPPPVSSLGVEHSSAPALMLKRTQDFVGNRAKWFHHKLFSTATVEDSLQLYAQQDYELMAPVVVPLELDDYQKVWNGSTPHKAFRAIDKALRPYKITVK